MSVFTLIFTINLRKIEYGDFMLYNHKELKEMGLSNYQIEKKVEQKELYKLQKGLYATELEHLDLAKVIKRHPNVIVTLESACYCYGLIKKEPEKVVVATIQNARKIKEDYVRQIFMTTAVFSFGMRKITYRGIVLQIYDLERLLVEVIRNSHSMPDEIYQEILSGYKSIVKLLNKQKLNQYISLFKDKKIKQRILEIIDM